MSRKGKTCPTCGATFAGPGQRRYCSPGCRPSVLAKVAARAGRGPRGRVQPATRWAIAAALGQPAPPAGQEAAMKKKGKK